jgi:hypothetical protein
MSNRAVISNRLDSSNGWILHSDAQKPGEDPLDRGPFFLNLFEGITSIIDLFSNTRAQAEWPCL